MCKFFFFLYRQHDNDRENLSITELIVKFDEEKCMIYTLNICVLE